MSATDLPLLDDSPNHTPWLPHLPQEMHCHPHLHPKATLPAAAFIEVHACMISALLFCLEDRANITMKVQILLDNISSFSRLPHLLPSGNPRQARQIYFLAWLQHEIPALPMRHSWHFIADYLWDVELPSSNKRSLVPGIFTFRHILVANPSVLSFSGAAGTAHNTLVLKGPDRYTLSFLRTPCKRGIFLPADFQ